MRVVAGILMLCSIASSEVIDRIAVTVGNKVVTESELLRQIRITALLNGERADFSPANKRRTADRLVEQFLIRHDLELSGYVSASAAKSVPAYEQFKKKFKTDQEYARLLAEYSIEDSDVRESFEWQTNLLEFVDARFRPGVQIPDSELRDYFENTVLTQIASTEVRPDFESVRDEIEKILVAQRVDNALDRWLGQARTQTRIRYRQEVFR